MEFYIVIRISYKEYRLKVAQTFVNERKEEYTITSKSQLLVLHTNRPVFRNRGLKHRRANWYVGQNPNKLHNSTIQLIINSITSIIDEKKLSI